MSRWKAPLPREHGAWGLLLQPFAAGAVLAGQWTWPIAPALGLVLLGFLLREPLAVAARHRWVWRRGGEQFRVAILWLAALGAALTVCFALLVRSTPLAPLLALVGVGATLTATSVVVTMRNRQRSISFQLVSAAGLGTTALLAALVSTKEIPGWAWWAWGILTAHAMASILVVHARLQARAALRGGGASGTGGFAYAGQALQLAAALAVSMVEVRLALPLVLSVVANVAELRRLRTPRHLQEPLTRVGFRTLAVSLVHLAAAIVCLWPLARG